METYVKIRHKQFHQKNPIQIPVSARDLSILFHKALETNQCPICDKPTNDAINNIKDKLKVLETSDNSLNDISINLNKLYTELPENSYRENARLFEKYKLDLELAKLDTSFNHEIADHDLEDYEKPIENTRLIETKVRK